MQEQTALLSVRFMRCVACVACVKELRSGLALRAWVETVSLSASGRRLAHVFTVHRAVREA